MMLVLGMSVGAQEIHYSYGLVSAVEHIGEDIKSGEGYSFGADFDFFRDKKFDFGPTFGYTKLGRLKTSSEDIASEGFLEAGLNAGWSGKRLSFKTSAKIPFTEKIKEHALFKMVSTQSVTYKFKEDSPFAIRAGFDYYFNRHIFHYTYRTSLGLSLKF